MTQTLEVILDVISVKDLPEKCVKHQTSHLRIASYNLRIAIDEKELLSYICSEDDGQRNIKSGCKEEVHSGSGSGLEKQVGCTISKTSNMSVILECKHSHIHKTHRIAAWNVNNFVTTIPLNLVKDIQLHYEVDSQKKTITIALKVSRVATSAELSRFKLNTRVKPHYTIPDLVRMDIVPQLLKDCSEISCPEWVNLLGSMKKVVDIVESIAEVDGKAKVAISAVTIAFELFMKQRERDERVLSLVQLMSTLYTMLLDSDPLDKCQTLRNAIDALISCTRECAYFIKQYMETESFVERTISNAFASTDDIIGQFEKQFYTLKEVFFTGVMLSIGKMNIRILKKLDEMDDTLQYIVENLSLPVLGVSWNKSDGCINGTQEPLLSKIYQWGMGLHEDNPNIFILYGPSKSGKTAVANSVANYFHQQRRLGAAIFLDDNCSKSDQLFFPALARELSRYHPIIYNQVISGLKDNNKFLNDRPFRQFEFINQNVFGDLQMAGPTLVVLDGLDRLADMRDLISPLSRFPKNIRILITCQELPDLSKRLSTNSYVMQEMTIDDDGLHQNLETYISEYLSNLHKLRPQLFRTYEKDRISHDLYVMSNGIFMLSKAALQCIATVTDNIAHAIIHSIATSRLPGDSREALELMKEVFLSAMSIQDPSIVNCMRGIYSQEIEETVKHLVDLQLIERQDDHLNVDCYTFIVGKDVLYFARTSRCKPSKCNSSSAISFLNGIQHDEPNSLLGKKSVYNALSCLYSCTCAESPVCVGTGISSTLSTQVRKHWEKCLSNIQEGDIDILTAARFPKCSKICIFDEAWKLVLHLRDVPPKSSQLECVLSALHCMITCKCTYPPKFIEQGSSMISFFSDRWPTCLSGLNSSINESAILNILVSHHTLRSVSEPLPSRFFTRKDDSNSSVVKLVAGETVKSAQVTLVEFQLKLSRSDILNMPKEPINFNFSVKIIRTLSEETEDWSSRPKSTLGIFLVGMISGPNYFKTGGYYQTLEHPLSGNKFWTLAKIVVSDSFESECHSVVWFNCPVDANANFMEDDRVDADTGQGQGIGFLNELHPGDVILVHVNSELQAGISIEANIKLYDSEDTDTRCPLLTNH